MDHLFVKRRNGQYEQWSNGIVPFFEDHRHSSGRVLPVSLVCMIGESMETVLLDTGATWSTIGEREANNSKFPYGESLGEISYKTPEGRLKGRLCRSQITILADQRGKNLELEGTFFISEEWNGLPTVIGFNLLKNIRFALDPINGVDLFYFGNVV